MPEPEGDRHRVAAAVLVSEGRVLLAHRRSDRRWYPGCWDLVGGHIEPGESPLDAMRRECREELGIVVDGAEPVPIGYSDPAVEAYGFVIRSWRGEPRNCQEREHDALGWFAADDLSGLRLADDALVDDLRAALATG